MSDAYAGLPRATIGFLAALAAHNDRDWMAAHRADYERDWKAAGIALARALVIPAADIGLTVVPKIDGSLRRLHRDTRFSADKRPFHARMHLVLAAGEPVGKRPAVHLVIGPEGFDYGVGEWAMPPARLAAYRAALCDATARGALLRHVAAAEGLGCAFDPPDLARLPRGFTAAGDWEHLLRRRHFVLRTPSPRSMPDALFGPAAPDLLAGIAATLAPVAHWLAELE
jgi:uncharacterized protein (TIGR02453 family)